MTKEKELDEAQQQSLVTRLNRIEGQIRGIRRMVQEPRMCIEILQQLAAAEAALIALVVAGGVGAEELLEEVADEGEHLERRGGGAVEFGFEAVVVEPQGETSAFLGTVLVEPR